MTVPPGPTPPIPALVPGGVKAILLALQTNAVVPTPPPLTATVAPPAGLGSSGSSATRSGSSVTSVAPVTQTPAQLAITAECLVETVTKTQVIEPTVSGSGSSGSSGTAPVVAKTAAGVAAAVVPRARLQRSQPPTTPVAIAPKLSTAPILRRSSPPCTAACSGVTAVVAAPQGPGSAQPAGVLLTRSQTTDESRPPRPSTPRATRNATGAKTVEELAVIDGPISRLAERQLPPAEVTVTGTSVATRDAASPTNPVHTVPPAPIRVARARF